MIWEVHCTRRVEANDFFHAVEKAKKIVSDEEEVISVCPFAEEDLM